MRIAITVDPIIPVPPQLYGGIERIVDFVARGLLERGHNVTLFAHRDSSVSCELIPYGFAPHEGWARTAELSQLAVGLWRRRHEFDAVLSWGRLAALVPILPYHRLLKIQFYCRDSVPWGSVRIAARIGAKSILFSGSSDSVYDQLPLQGGKGGIWHTMYYGVELSRYTFHEVVAADAPLVFLGRIERVKGTHTAIRIARATGSRLVVAGNRIDTPDGRAYFEREVEPWLDGKQITYIGPVDDLGKQRLLGQAAALLFPVDWREAFGIVMAESLACGTPVIGFANGSVPEVVVDGVNGFVCRNIEDANEAVRRLHSISRARVREDCERRFSSTAILDQLESRLQLHTEVLGKNRFTRPANGSRKPAPSTG